MKVCNICNVESEPYKESAKVCKSCHSKAGTDKRRSLSGHYRRIFYHQQERVRNGTVISISYSSSELKDWLLSNSVYLKLHSQWKDSGFNKELSPSVDRINDYLGYSLENIQVMTWHDNNMKGKADRISGYNNKQSTQFIQKSKDGITIATYHSGQQASRETGIDRSNITRAASGKCKTAGGFIWESY